MRKDNWVMVINERDLSDGERSVIGVTSNRDNALQMIKDYYGKDSVQTDFIDVRDSMVDCYVNVYVPGNLGGKYSIRIEDHLIDDNFD